MTLLPPSWSEKLGYTAMNDRQVIASILQPGVIGGKDYKVEPASGLQSSIAAGKCAVANTFQSTQGGLYIVQNNAPVLVTHAAGNSTNPRIDQIFARVFDSSDGGDSSDLAEMILVEGTPTAGATLENRNGVGANPRNSLRMADVLVPAGAATASAFTYRDRRPWARGAFWWTNTATVETEARVATLIPNWKVRLETLGFYPLRFIFSGIVSCTAECTVNVGFYRNGFAEVGVGEYFIPAASVNKQLMFSYDMGLVVGGGSGEGNPNENGFSSLWEVRFSCTAGKLKLWNNSYASIEEVTRPGGENGQS